MKKLLALYIPLLSALTIVPYILFNRFPWIRTSLVEEDYFLENLSALLFLGCFLLGLAQTIGLMRQQVKRWHTTGALTLAGLAGFLEEVGFGGRLFNLSMPTVGGKVVDSLHNLAEAILKYRYQGPAVLLVGAWGLLAAAITAGLMLIIWRVKRADNASAPGPALPVFLAVAAALLMASLVLDYEPAYWSTLWHLNEELLEASGALTLLFASYAAYGSAVKNAQ